MPTGTSGAQTSTGRKRVEDGGQGDAARDEQDDEQRSEQPE
jgi:hypothetical protein